MVSIGALTWLFRSIDGTELLAALSWRVVSILLPALVAYGIVTLVLEAASIVLLMLRQRRGRSKFSARRI